VYTVSFGKGRAYAVSAEVAKLGTVVVERGKARLVVTAKTPLMEIARFETCRDVRKGAEQVNCNGFLAYPSERGVVLELRVGQN
jgi:hypothetical protein